MCSQSYFFDASVYRRVHTYYILLSNLAEPVNQANAFLPRARWAASQASSCSRTCRRWPRTSGSLPSSGGRRCSSRSRSAQPTVGKAQIRPKGSSDVSFVMWRLRLVIISLTIIEAWKSIKGLIIDSSGNPQQDLMWDMCTIWAIRNS